MRDSPVSRIESGSTGVQQAGVAVLPSTPSSSSSSIGMAAIPSIETKAMKSPAMTEVVDLLEPMLKPRLGIR